jgi:hypothetical protein
MQVGSAQSQSQSLIASISVTRTQSSSSSQLVSPGGSQSSSVLLNVGQQIDANYVQTVLDTSLTDKINGAFQSAGMDTNVESLLSSGLDFSPQATADRIVGMATSFFGAFQLNHQGQEKGIQIEGFTSLVKDAVKAGFEEAGSILSGIGDISPEIAADIDETFGLVMKGLDDFAEEQESALVEPSPEENAAAEELVVI